MEILRLESDYIKLYSVGIEHKYKGSSIIYYDNTLTFLYFYMPSYMRLYIINGQNKKKYIPQVKEKINHILTLEGKYARRFKNFMDEKLKTEKIVFFFPPIFIREISCVIECNDYKFYMERIYKKYKNRYKNGIIHINI